MGTSVPTFFDVIRSFRGAYPMKIIDTHDWVSPDLARSWLARLLQETEVLAFADAVIGEEVHRAQF